jgi:alpha-galactosidase
MPDLSTNLFSAARLIRLGSIVTLGVVLSSAPAGAVTPLATHADAYVTHEAGADSWTIGNAAVTVAFRLGADHELTLAAMSNPRSSKRFAFVPGADSALTLDGDVLALRDQPGILRFGGGVALAVNGGVQLAFTYTHEKHRAKIVRYYACYPTSPTIETWTRVEVDAGAAPVSLSELTGWHLTIPAGTIHWIDGLRQDAPDTPSTEAFALRQKNLAPGEQLALASHWRSSELFVPFVAVEGDSETWYGGIAWSGAWNLTFAREDGNLRVTASFPGTTTASAATPFEVPHTFFGVAPGKYAAVGASVRPFIEGALLQGRAWFPLVTYNTWYSYATRIDEGTIRNEINQTAALGVELFVMDAGWYPGAGRNGVADFETGLGTWMADPERFPNGLRPLADFAHESGVKFGLWVEPARISLDTLGRDGLAQDAWLAKRDGRNVSDTAGQICFGSRAGRQWVLGKLTRLIDEVQPDYLKWDNNSWLNCNRADHDHGTGDGNLVQVGGLYAVLETLRERYPKMEIENVADGGSRIDFGWLRYSSTAWVSDRTAPAAHVRHAFQGLSTVFPPAYLLSFMIDDAAEPLIGATDLIGALRSRMLGILGFSHRSPGLRPSIAGPFAQAIADYKSMRDILVRADALLLTDQVDEVKGDAWDVVEELDATTGNAVVFAFEPPGNDRRLLIHPRGLRPDATYSVRSLDAGAIDTLSGEALMENGIDFAPGVESRSHVIVLRVQ